MNNPERVAALEALLSRIQKNAAKPRAPSRTGTSSPSMLAVSAERLNEPVHDTSQWVGELGTHSAPAPATPAAAAPAATSPAPPRVAAAAPTPAVTKPLGFGARGAAPATPAGVRGFGGGASRPVVPKPAESRPSRPGFGAKAQSPAAPPVDFNATIPADSLVIERTSPIPEPVSPPAKQLLAEPNQPAAAIADAGDLPIVGAPILSVDADRRPDVERSAEQDAIVDPPTVDLPTKELPRLPRDAFDAPQPSIEQMLADVPPPPPPSLPEALEPAHTADPVAAVAGPFAPITKEVEPAPEAPAEPPPSFANESAPSKFTEAPPTSQKGKSSILPLLLVALLVLVVGAGAFLYMQSQDKKPPPLPGATGEAKPTATATVTATATATATATETAATAVTDTPSGSAATASADPGAGSTPKDPASLPKNMGYFIVNAPEAGVILSKGKTVGETGKPFEIQCGNVSYSWGKKMPNGGMQMGRPKTTNVACQQVTTFELNAVDITAPPPLPPGGGGATPPGGGTSPGGTPPGGGTPPPGGGDPYEPSAP